MIRRVTDGAEYLGMLRGLLPRGPIWSPEPGSNLEALLLVIGDELARLHNRVVDALDEADPRTVTAETIDAWERAYGLPDPCDPSPPTSLSQRVAAVSARVAQSGGQSADYYIRVAAAMGITVTIDERPYGVTARSETATSETPANQVEVMFYWEITGPAATSTDERNRLECVIARIKPAHTVAVWSWTA